MQTASYLQQNDHYMSGGKANINIDTLDVMICKHKSLLLILNFITMVSKFR